MAIWIEDNKKERIEDNGKDLIEDNQEFEVPSFKLRKWES